VIAALLKLSQLIDTLNEWIGKLIMWLILAAVLISAGNAIMRKAFDIGSNAFLEIQWYLFAAVFMLGAGYVFLRNAHVRIDFIATKLSKRTNAIIDILGIVLFTIPLSLILVNLSWPVFERAWVSGEMSQNAGGLIRWPVLLLIPLGFGLLAAAVRVRTHQARGLPHRASQRALQRRGRQERRGRGWLRNWPPPAAMTPPCSGAVT
jgi:TRAP-type mannitol/chloroaromatic compound transport system permease small subunit